MDDWDDLRFVLAMARHGTMSGAARRLGTNVATVSRRLDKLAHELGSPLFERRGQHWAATPAALHLAALAERVDQELRAGALAGAAADGPPVPLEIAAPPSVHAALLLPRVTEMLRRFPFLRPSLANKVFAQGLGEADVQIRVGRPEGGRLRARRLLSYRSHVYVRPGSALDGRWIGLGPRVAEADHLRELYPAADPLPTIRVEEMALIADLVRETGLPGYMPDFLAARRPGLAPADLPGNVRRNELWIAYHETRHGDAALRAVVDWIAQGVAPPPG